MSVCGSVRLLTIQINNDKKCDQYNGKDRKSKTIVYMLSSDGKDAVFIRKENRQHKNIQLAVYACYRLKGLLRVSEANDVPICCHIWVSPSLFRQL